MNKVALGILSSIFLFGSLFAQEKINQVNAQGERIGVWQKFYQNKKIRYQGQFENGKEVGVFKYYSPVSSEFPMVLKTFEANSHQALVQHFTLKGLPESEGLMKGKERIGKWVYYQKDGKTILIGRKL